MTDEELIKTLRGRNGFGWTEDAADRIEQLVAQQEEFGTDSFDRIMELSCKLTYTNAKLAKAVAALREVEGSSATYQERAKARAVLEELEKLE